MILDIALGVLLGQTLFGILGAALTLYAKRKTLKMQVSLLKSLTEKARERGIPFEGADFSGLGGDDIPRANPGQYL